MAAMVFSFFGNTRNITASCSWVEAIRRDGIWSADRLISVIHNGPVIAAISTASARCRRNNFRPAAAMATRTCLSTTAPLAARGDVKTETRVQRMTGFPGLTPQVQHTRPGILGQTTVVPHRKNWGASALAGQAEELVRVDGGKLNGQLIGQCDEACNGYLPRAEIRRAFHAITLAGDGRPQQSCGCVADR